jgi:uncharacterized protein (TIGR03067 family)
MKTKTLLTIVALAAAFTATAAAQTPAPTAVSKDLAALQGTWLMISINDQAIADQGVEMAFVVTGNKYQQVMNGQLVESGTLKVDAAKAPATLDLTILEGDDAGKLQLGIMEVTGDTMKALLGAPGATTRPADFTSSAGEVFLVAKRVK